MTALTTDQITDFRNDLADNFAEQAFTQEELQRLYDRTGGDYNRAMVLAIQQLQMSTVKLETWKRNNVGLNGEEVFHRLDRMRELWQQTVDQSQQQVVIAGMQSTPLRLKDYTSTDFRPMYPRRRYRGW